MNRVVSFIIFLTVFLTLYGLLHFYFYRKVIRALDTGNIGHIALLLILCFLLISPIITSIMAEGDHGHLTSVIAYVTYIWMGGLFLFFTINLLIDIYRLIIYVSARIFTPVLSHYMPGDKITLIITLLIVTGIVIYGRFEAEDIGVEKITVNTSKLPADVHFRVVQITDIHFSPTNGVRLARKIVKIVDGLHGDLIVSTGDLIDRGLQDEKEVTSLFRDLKAPQGKYATTGNHEFITGIEKAVRFTEDAGFRMLRNESVTVGKFLNILAVDDPAGKRFGIDSGISEEMVLRGFLPDRLNIFLKHQPRIKDNSPGKFDIQLSGHTHAGQIFPFNLVESLFYYYMAGLHKVSKNSYLYVSRGTGTWGPPIRFLAPPEITAIDFQNPG